MRRAHYIIYTLIFQYYMQIFVTVNAFFTQCAIFVLCLLIFSPTYIATLFHNNHFFRQLHAHKKRIPDSLFTIYLQSFAPSKQKNKANSVPEAKTKSPRGKPHGLFVFDNKFPFRYYRHGSKKT